VTGDINIAEGQYYRYGAGILAYAQTALHNYYFGSAGNLTTTGTYNVAIGDTAATNLGVNAHGNISIGHVAGGNSSTGTYNVFVGHASGYGGAGVYAGSSFNVSVGKDSLYQIAAASSGNTALGTSAGYNSSTGTYNVFVGMEAGYGSGGVYAGSNYNTAVGYRAGYDLGAAALNNTLIGALAGENLTTGDGNVLLGYSAGSALTTADNKLYIANAAAGNGSVLITGDFTQGNVGIGTATFDATAQKVFSIYTGVEPAALVTDCVQLYSYSGVLGLWDDNAAQTGKTALDEYIEIRYKGATKFIRLYETPA
jgi:hypothetical protein